MTKQKSTPEYVTREILKEEISASENRLGSKLQGLDTKVDNVENRLGTKLQGLDTKIDSVESRLDTKIDNVEKRLDAKISSLDVKVDMIEKRLDSKIETTAQSLKEYTDSRFTRLDEKTESIERTVKEQGKKMDVYFNGIVKMLEGVTGKVSIADDRLKDHEKRITVLEGRGAQPGRI